MNDKRKVYLFPHIPKTGGAALTSNVECSLPRNKCLRLNCTQKQFYYHPKTGGLRFYESERDFTHLIDSLSEEEKLGIEFVSGHDLPYGLHQRFSQPARYILFVREPVARTLSLYNYQKSQHEFLKKMKDKDESHRRIALFSQKWFLIDGKVPSFEDWLEFSYDGNYPFYSTMTRFLQRYQYLDAKIESSSWDRLFEKFFFVGLTETLNEDELYLYGVMNTRRFWADRNSSTPFVSKRLLDQRLQERIREKNREDFELYERAKEFNSAFKAREKNFRKVVFQMRVLKKSLWLSEHFTPEVKSLLRPVRGYLRKISGKLSFHFKRRMKQFFLFLINSILFIQKKKLPIPEQPKRILICNLANFGDVVISTTVLPILKKRYPQCEIGFLTSLKTGAVLKNHPLVTHLHTMNHWYGNRERGYWRSVLGHLTDFQRTAKEIEQYKYDLAIDLYPEFIQSAIPLVARAKIPIRIARVSQGHKSLITHEISRFDPTLYMGQNHLNLLGEIQIGGKNESPLPHYFCMRPTSQPLPKEYTVIHMGTAVAFKKWDTRKWIQIVRELMDRGDTVLLTGSGSDEAINCKAVSSETGCLNYCNQLSWSDFAGLIQHAKLLISVDSASIHIASALKVPSVILFSGVSPIPLWKPATHFSIAVTKPVPCAPCSLSNGCKKMSCIQEIEPEDVLKLLKNRLTLHTL